MKSPAKIAVTLLTCNRPSYTAKTIATFNQFNRGDDRFILLHADDASDTDENMDLASSAGFTSVVRNKERRGWLPTRLDLFKAAEGHASWVLFLENDIETMRAFPWPVFDMTSKMRQIACLRLYGRFKDAEKLQPCLDTHKRFGHMPVDWRPFRDAPEPCSIGTIHWSAQPSVTRLNDLLALHKHGIEPRGATVRVKENVMSHFGVERTMTNTVAARNLSVFNQLAAAAAAKEQATS